MLSIAMLVYAITPELEAMTRRAVLNLLDETTGDFEIRVLFNGGPTVALVDDPRVVPIYMAEPMSIAQAYNLAFSCARGDVFACVHNDVTVPYAWNEPLVAACGAGFAFPMLREDEFEAAERGVGTTQPTFPPGCCFVFPRSVFETLSGFDEEYEGCHFEDTDLWMRGLRKGLSLVRVGVIVEHGRGRTRTALPDLANAAFRRNKQRYIERYTDSAGTTPLPWLSPCPQEVGA